MIGYRYSHISLKMISRVLVCPSPTKNRCEPSNTPSPVQMPLLPDPNTPVVELLKAWLSTQNNELNEEYFIENMRKIEACFTGMCASSLPKMPLNSIQMAFRSGDLSATYVSSFEAFLGGGIFIVDEAAPLTLVNTEEGGEEGEERDDEGGAQPSRGGRRVPCGPVSKKRRITDDYIQMYHHPKEFYSLPRKITSLNDEHTILTCLLAECEAVAGDAYWTAKEQACVVNERRMSVMGIPKPRPYGGFERSWGVTPPPLPPLPCAFTCMCACCQREPCVLNKTVHITTHPLFVFCYRPW